jgi:hypothetical protein
MGVVFAAKKPVVRSGLEIGFFPVDHGGYSPYVPPTFQADRHSETRSAKAGRCSGQKARMGR